MAAKKTAAQKKKALAAKKALIAKKKALAAKKKVVAAKKKKALAAKNTKKLVAVMKKAEKNRKKKQAAMKKASKKKAAPKKKKAAPKKKKAAPKKSTKKKSVKKSKSGGSKMAKKKKAPKKSGSKKRKNPFSKKNALTVAKNGALAIGGAVAGGMAANAIPVKDPRIKAAIPLILGVLLGSSKFGKTQMMQNVATGLVVAGGMSMVRVLAPQLPFLAGEGEYLPEEYEEQELLGIDEDYEDGDFEDIDGSMGVEDMMAGYMAEDEDLFDEYDV